MKEWLKDYFSFSRKERTGMAVLLVIIFSIWLLPEYFGERESLSPGVMHKADSLLLKKGYHTEMEDSVKLKTFRLFYFDPNTLDDEGWRQLGMREKPVSIIRHYLEKGGRFRQAGDLLKIYAIRTDEARRLMPYVRIRQESISRSGYGFMLKKEGIAYAREQPRHPNYTWKGQSPGKVVRGININTADTADWIQLPGIGSRLANRIVSFRERLGGFCRVGQVAEVYGLSDSVFQILRPYLLLKDTLVRQVFINRLDTDSLCRHPYIRYNEARAIVQYRKIHGNFINKEDLLNISVIGREWLEKIEPYLSLNAP